MAPGHIRGGSRREGKLLFPVAGAVTGLLTFLAFYFISPAGSGNAASGGVSLARVRALPLSVVALWWGNEDGWMGKIGKIAIVSGNMSAGDVSTVNDYLLRKWGISR